MYSGEIMGFIESIKECFGEWEIPKEPIFRAVLFGESAGYFENVKSILNYSENEIVLSLKKGGLKVAGEGLYIKKYCMGDIVICGKILKVERV